MRDSARAIAMMLLATACSPTNAADAGTHAVDGRVDDANDLDAQRVDAADATHSMDARLDAEDAWVCDDWVSWGCPPPPPPPQPADFTPPTVPCDADTGVGDPCAHWVDCVPSDVDGGDPWGAWAVTWSGGSCVSGACVFAPDPTVEFCYAGCSWHTGVDGRCTNPGPTAP